MHVHSHKNEGEHDHHHQHKKTTYLEFNVDWLSSWFGRKWRDGSVNDEYS